MWTVERRIKWRMIITVIYATFAVAKESLKTIEACAGFEPLTSTIPVQRSTNYAKKPTVSRLLIWFVIDPWKDDDEVLNMWKSYMCQRMIIAVIYATFAVAGLYKIQTLDLCNTNKLVSLIGRALHRYAEVKGLNPVQAWIFFRLSFCNCKSCI